MGCLFPAFFLSHDFWIDWGWGWVAGVVALGAVCRGGGGGGSCLNKQQHLNMLLSVMAQSQLVHNSSCYCRRLGSGTKNIKIMLHAGREIQ